MNKSIQIFLEIFFNFIFIHREKYSFDIQENENNLNFPFPPGDSQFNFRGRIFKSHCLYKAENLLLTFA